MKHGLSLLAALMLCVALLAGCASDSGKTDFNLADFSNPFIGEWQSEIPSANTTLTFNYKPDGTFDYEMAGVPAEQGGKGSGGYAIYGGTMITWLDFEGEAAYTFEVKDNDAINVTELEPDANRQLVAGDATPFTRVAGSNVSTQNMPFSLTNLFIGEWYFENPDENEACAMAFKADGTFTYTASEIGAEDGSRGSGEGCYIVYGENLILFYPDYNMTGKYTFVQVDEDDVDVTEYVPNGQGELVPGTTALFTRVQ